MNSLSSIIPGYGDLTPILFNLNSFNKDELRNISVLAGHFPWGIWSQLPSVREVNNNQKREIEDNKEIPSCFVMGRHPLDRIISYYYQRYYPISKISFNNLTSSELISLIQYFRQALTQDNGESVVVDEGIRNACCRALANRKTTSGQSIANVTIPPDLTKWEEEYALENVNKCVVGLQEDWINTKRIMNYWFPWMNININEKEEEKKKRMKSNEKRESMEIIRSDLREIVEEMNGCDMKLYEKMKILFKKQLSVIESKSYL